MAKRLKQYTRTQLCKRAARMWKQSWVSHLKVPENDGSYWLSTDGRFYSVDTMGHLYAAQDLLPDRNWDDSEWESTRALDAYDYLFSKGFARVAVYERAMETLVLHEKLSRKQRKVIDEWISVNPEMRRVSMC